MTSRRAGERPAWEKVPFTGDMEKDKDMDMAWFDSFDFLLEETGRRLFDPDPKAAPRAAGP